MRAPDDIWAYRSEVQSTLKAILGESLLAIYIGGSTCFGNFRMNVSDIDIFAFVEKPLADEQKEHIYESLRHDHLPCPAYGLDFIIYRRDQLQPAPRSPIYEFSLSTGAHWVDEVDFGGEYPGGIIDLALLREQGIIELGPCPKEFIHPVNQDGLKEELMEGLDWHKHHVHDRFHDPTGANAVLNACRALRYFAAGELVSKSEGGSWALSEMPEHEVVSQALAMRDGERQQPLSHDDVVAFLEAVEKRAAILL